MPEPFAERLIAKTLPWMTEDFRLFLKAVAAPYEAVEAITKEAGEQGGAGWVPPYAVVMNPATCPYKYLPWLGQFVGVEVRKTATEAEARAEVKAESGLARGTRGSLEALLKKALGSVPFLILEREPTAYSLVIVIPMGYVTTMVYEEINLTIPAGVIYSIVEVSGSWYSGTKTWNELGSGKTWNEMTEGNY